MKKVLHLHLRDEERQEIRIRKPSAKQKLSTLIENFNSNCMI
jgi:hypothetical protein